MKTATKQYLLTIITCLIILISCSAIILIPNPFIVAAMAIVAGFAEFFSIFWLCPKDNGHI